MGANELATMQGGNGHQPPALPPSKALYDFEQMKELAKAVSDSGFINGVRSQSAALALMLVCQAQGRHIGEAITRFHVIKNTPSVKADVMLADFQARGGRVRWVESTAEVCRAEFSHPKLHPEPLPVTVSMRDLVENRVAMEWKEDKNGQGKYVDKKVYKQFPAQMLRARCISQGVPAIDPGARYGFITAEEAEDSLVVEAEVVARVPEAPLRESERPAPRGDVAVPGQPPSPNGLDERPFVAVVSEAAAFLGQQARDSTSAQFGGELPEEIEHSPQPYEIHKHILNALIQSGRSREDWPATRQAAVKLLLRHYAEHRDFMREQIKEFEREHGARLHAAIEREAEKRNREAVAPPEDESQEDTDEEFAGLRGSAAREPGQDG